MTRPAVRWCAATETYRVECGGGACASRRFATPRVLHELTLEAFVSGVVGHGSDVIHATCPRCGELNRL